VGVGLILTTVLLYSILRLCHLLPGQRHLCFSTCPKRHSLLFLVMKLNGSTHNSL